MTLRRGHFDSTPSISIDGMVSCEDLFQLTRAITKQIALHMIASARETYPNGRDISRSPGMKTKATASNATVLV
jgi:hypothetical protein